MSTDAPPNVTVIPDFILNGRWVVKNCRLSWQEGPRGYIIGITADTDAPKGELSAYLEERIEAVFKRNRQ